MLTWFCPVLDAGNVSPVRLPSPAPASSPTPVATPVAVTSPQATMQPISAFMRVPKGWKLDRRVRVLSALTEIRFQAMKPDAGGVESINVTESNAPHAGTFSENVKQAIGLLGHLGTNFHLISSRSSFVCAGTRAAWRLHYRLDIGPMHLFALQYIAESPHGSFDAATYMQTGIDASDPAALAALGTFCPQDFVALPATAATSVIPGLRAPLPVGWAQAGSGNGMMSGSRVLASASKKLAGGTAELYQVITFPMRNFGYVAGKPLSLDVVAEYATKALLALYYGSTVLASAKVAGCGGSEPQWQFEVRSTTSFLIERIVQRNGRAVADIYLRPIGMLQPGPAALSALNALCLTSSVASIQ